MSVLSSLKMFSQTISLWLLSWRRSEGWVEDSPATDVPAAAVVVVEDKNLEEDKEEEKDIRKINGLFIILNGMEERKRKGKFLFWKGRS